VATEFERIALIQAILGPPPNDVSLGIGDDAAVLAPCQPEQQLVWTVDSFVEGVHFRPDLMTWRDVGWRSLMTAASDLAAMAATPIGALAALVLPTSLRDNDLLDIARGQRNAAQTISTAVVGGNLSRGSEVSISTTLLGRTTAPVRRDSARAGHALVACGDIGLAAAGLRLLLRDPKHPPDDADALCAIEAFRHPVARIADGLRFGPVGSALIDVSDGLAQDAAHICEASRVRIEIDLGSLIDDRIARLARRVGVDASDLVLNGGDDYALLGTVAADQVPEGFRVIGRCVEGHGVWLAGTNRRIDLHGHDHFRSV